jgi:oligopeptidase B
MFLSRSVVTSSFLVPTLVLAGVNAPQAPQIEHQITEVGHSRNDPFFWLREKDNPEVLKYLKAENGYTESALKHIGKLEETLYNEMRGRIKESDISVPEKIDEYYYYSRTETGKQYGIYCRKKGTLDAKEEVLLDENELAKGQKYFRIGALSVSRDHQLLAYTTDTNGSETYVLRVKSLQTGELLPDEIKNCSESLAWANDNKTLFYGQLDEAHRPYQAFKHVLGTKVEQDTKLYEEKDDRFFLEISKSRNARLIFISVESELSSEVRFLEADQPGQELRLIRPRENDLLYNVENHDDRFFIVTNEKAKNFKIVEAPLASPGKENWKDFIPYDPDIKIDSVDAFANDLAISERRKGLPAIRIYDLKTKESHEMSFDEPAYDVSWSGSIIVRSPRRTRSLIIICPPAKRSSGRRKQFWAGIGKAITPRSVFSPRQKMGWKFQSRWSTKKALKRMGRLPCCSTAMAPTGSAPTQTSIPTPSACLIEALFSPSRISAEAGN